MRVGADQLARLLGRGQVSSKVLPGGSSMLTWVCEDRRAG
jgi:hypothetical protein